MTKRIHYWIGDRAKLSGTENPEQFHEIGRVEHGDSTRALLARHKGGVRQDERADHRLLFAVAFLLTFAALMAAPFAIDPVRQTVAHWISPTVDSLQTGSNR